MITYSVHVDGACRVGERFSTRTEALESVPEPFTVEVEVFDNDGKRVYHHTPQKGLKMTGRISECVWESDNLKWQLWSEPGYRASLTNTHTSQTVDIPFLYELEKNGNYLKLPKYVVEAIGFHHPGYGKPIEEREDAKFTARFPDGFFKGSYDNSALESL